MTQFDYEEHFISAKFARHCEELRQSGGIVRYVEHPESRTCNLPGFRKLVICREGGNISLNTAACFQNVSKDEIGTITAADLGLYRHSCIYRTYTVASLPLFWRVTLFRESH